MTNQLRRDAFRLIALLADEILHNMGAEARSQAEECLDDASGFFEDGEFARARQRAQRGIRYIREGVEKSGTDAGIAYAEQQLARRTEA